MDLFHQDLWLSVLCLHHLREDLAVQRALLGGEVSLEALHAGDRGVEAWAAWIPLVASAMVALAWWLAIARRFPSAVGDPEFRLRLVVVLGFAGLQVAAGFLTLALSRRRSGAFPAAGVAIVLLLGNVLYWFTPVLGAPIVALAAVAASCGLLVSRGDG